MQTGNSVALVIGPGPVTLGQGACFQYAAARACRRLREMGLRVLVLEDNPATLMDMDGGEGDLFMEPPAPEVVERIVEGNGVESLWYCLGGKRAWILALGLAGEEWYERLGLSTPGLDDRTLWLCGDRSLLREALEAKGMANPDFHAIAGTREGQRVAEAIGFPLVVRPHFSCGGWGAGLAYNLEEYSSLLEEAIRESLTGEVLIEEALIGWRKYIALVLRDGWGVTAVPGILEQVDPLPRHDHDAVLVCPPPGWGKEEAYALETMAREVVETLDLTGLAEVKLAVHPRWEAIYVIDVNPWPWRTMTMLETALGVDLLRVCLDLVMGGELSSTLAQLEQCLPCSTLIAVPRFGYRLEDQGQGYLALGCRSTGRMVCWGGTVREAVAETMRALSSDRGGPCEEGVVEALRTLRHRGDELEKNSIVVEKPGRPSGLSPLCLSRVAGADLSGGVLLLSGEQDNPGGGYELEMNCIQALAAWKKHGGKAVLYTPDPYLALFAVGGADAVFLGPLDQQAVIEAANSCGIGHVVAHFGGPRAWHCAAELVDSGLEVWGWKQDPTRENMRGILGDLRAAGLPVIDFLYSSNMEEGIEVLNKGSFPLLATMEEQPGESAQRLIYAREDGEDFLREYPETGVLWRWGWEEAHEIQSEVVAGAAGNHVILLWEQLDEAGICSEDGLAVYPPVFLTSEQTRKTFSLVQRTLDVLGWKGNLSLKIFLADGNIFLWDLSRGASANLPFLDRASSLRLAALGMMALSGREALVEEEYGHYSAVRAPLIPFRIIAASDILPSPHRRSTGAVIGLAHDPGVALAKALWSEGLRPQPGGKAFLSVANREKRRVVLLARELQELGYILTATRGTSHTLASSGMEVETVNKLREGRPNVLDHIRNGQIGLVVNIPRGKHPHSDGFYIRAASARYGIPCITDMEVALALARGLREADPRAWEVRPLREYSLSRHEVRGG